MNTMKRLIAVMLMLALALVCIACTQAPATNPGTTTTQKQEPTPSSTPVPTTTKAKPSHTVQVLDQNGNPVAGIAIQFCNDNGCYTPKMTNEAGIAEFFYPDVPNPKAKIYPAEEGSAYPYGTDAYTIDQMDGMEDGYMKFNGSTTLVLTVTAISG